MSRRFAFRSDCLFCRFNGPATLVPQHQNQADTKVLDRVFDASPAFVVDDVACHAQYEEITESLVEYNFGRHTRIGATDDNGKRMLALCNFRATLCGLTGMLKATARVAFIAFLEFGDGLCWRY